MDPLSEAFQHHLWATEALIAHLRTLPPESLDAEAPGVYGGVLATLSHLIAADARYLSRLEGDPPPPSTGPGPARTLGELADALRDHAPRWRIVLARAGELDVTIPAGGTWPETPHATNLLFAQALHHGTDHRSQVCTALTANGYAVPDIDVWSYWQARRV